MADKKVVKIIILITLSFIMVYALTAPVKAIQSLTNNELSESVKQGSILHGILDVVTINQDNKQHLQARLDVWWNLSNCYYCKVTEGYLKGLQIANNGQRKWMLVPDEKKSILYPAVPDTWKFIFQIGKEIDFLGKSLVIKKTGTDIVTGRHSDIIKVQPKGGLPYLIWVDKETGIVIRKETEFYNGLRQRIEYTELEFFSAIPRKLLVYNLPDGYTEILSEHEQKAESPEKISSLAGFTPKLPVKTPKNYISDGMSYDDNIGLVKHEFYHKSLPNYILLLQTTADSRFYADPVSIIGKIDEIIVEVKYPLESSHGILHGGILYENITDLWSAWWQEDGLEFMIIGNSPENEMIHFIKLMNPGKRVNIPYTAPFKPEIKAEYDIKQEKYQQISTDAGHSPYRLDPGIAALAYLNQNTESEPEQRLEYEDFKAIMNNGKEAIVEINDHKASLKRIYLKKIIRQDYTGIWTVVGIDPG